MKDEEPFFEAQDLTLLQFATMPVRQKKTKPAMKTLRKAKKTKPAMKESNEKSEDARH